MPSEPLVNSVADTARWIAHQRAVESRRPDALFYDHLAEFLAGERGAEVADPAAGHSGWSFVARTVLIDELICTSISAGCDLVLNLAAGFDTRPYRLALPAKLTWIEADHPALIAEKNELLAEVRPLCTLHRYSVDPADAGVRSAFLSDALRGARSALVLTEGMLGHFTNDDVAGLAKVLRRREVAWWMFDISNTQTGTKRAENQATVTGAESTSRVLDIAPRRFTPANGVAFFERLGWIAVDVCGTFRAAGTLGRLPWFLRLLSLLPQSEPDPRAPGIRPWNAVVRLRG